MQIWAESGKSALPICNYSQILYQFLTFTQNLKRSHVHTNLDLTSLLISSILFCIFSRVVFTFPPSAHWLLDFPGAYSYFSFSYAPAS